MAQKKRLGKDPFVSSTPADPKITRAEEPKVKASRTKKASTPAKETAVVAAAPVAAPAPAEKAPAPSPAVDNTRNAEIENVKRELAELQVMVQRLQQQLDLLNPWSEHFFSPWQWWFSLFS